MSASVYDRIERVVHGNERLLWTGRPRGGVRLSPDANWGILGFSVWVGFFLTIFVSNLTDGDLGAWTIAIVAAVVSVPVVVALFLGDIRTRRRAAYGLTDQRVIIVDGYGPEHVQSVPLQHLANITLRERGDGSGSIFCSSPGTVLYKRNNRGMDVPRPVFRVIVDVRHVHTLLMEARASVLQQTHPWAGRRAVGRPDGHAHAASPPRGGYH